MRSKYEKKAEKELQSEGYQTDYKSRPFRCPKGYTIDYFAIFDILAYKDGILRCIAIKGHQGVPSKLRKGIEAFKVEKIIKEIWTFKENKTVKREVIR